MLANKKITKGGYNKVMDIFTFLEENKIVYHNKALIKQAFIHSSYRNEHPNLKGDNERLEFMGDAVLQIYSSTLLFSLKPPLNEGEMSTRRSNLVCEEALAHVAKEFKLNQFLLLGYGEEKNGGRERDSIVSDMFEAFIGAVYIDTSYQNVVALLDILMKKHILNTSLFIDYKTQLQEYVQADSRKAIVYETLSSTGPSNEPTFEVVVKVDNLVFGHGYGSSKKEAQKAAAKDALHKLALIKKEVHYDF